MESSKSFSIDALLAKEPRRKEVFPPGPRRRSPPRPGPGSPQTGGRSSPEDGGSKSSSYSPGSQGGGAGSPALSSPRDGDPRSGGPGSPPHGPLLPPRGSFIPRPGLLHAAAAARHPALAGLPPSSFAAAGLFPPGHPLYSYPGAAGTHAPPGASPQQAAALSMLTAGSAFHLPSHEQALQAAQMHGVPLEWLARAGMLVPRPPDFPGESHTLFPRCMKS